MNGHLSALGIHVPRARLRASIHWVDPINTALKISIAVDEYGLPERVWSDLGGENVEVWRFMIEQHSSESSVITGSSTHNERIERLWRDVTRSVGS